MFSQLVTQIQKYPNTQLCVIEDQISQLEGMYYTYNFKVILNLDDEQVIDDFFKLLKIKAKKADLFAKNILTCDYLYTTPAGFMRKISQAAEISGKKDEIIERVLINEEKKSILFIQETTTGKIRLAAINSVVRENNNCFFIGKYIFEVLKNSQDINDKKLMLTLDKNLPLLSEAMIENLISFYKSGEIEKMYQFYYKE